MSESSFKWAYPLFHIEQSVLYDISVPFTRKTWHGRMKACRGIGASILPKEVINEFEKEHMEQLNKLPETFDILHYVTILNLRKRIN